jgi:hypothetical protein
VQVTALDLVTGEPLWSFQPSIRAHLPPSSLHSSLHIWAKLLKIRSHSRGTHPPETALLVSVSTAADAQGDASSVLLSYHFHGMTGNKLYVPSDKVKVRGMCFCGLN